MVYHSESDSPPPPRQFYKMNLQMKITGRAVALNSYGCSREAEIEHSLSLNGNVDGEPLSLAITSGLIVGLRGLNCGE